MGSPPLLFKIKLKPNQIKERSGSKTLCRQFKISPLLFQRRKVGQGVKSCPACINLPRMKTQSRDLVTCPGFRPVTRPSPGDTSSLQVTEKQRASPRSFPTFLLPQPDIPTREKMAGCRVCESFPLTCPETPARMIPTK